MSYKRGMAWLPLLVWICTTLSGCAAVSNPVANGIPVRRLPPELLAESKAELVPLPLSSLRQPKAAAYRLDADDVLGVWVEGVLGKKGETPPVQLPATGNLPPALGFPIIVRPDGTIALPLVDPIQVKGMTLEEAQKAVSTAYTVTKKILQPGQDRIIVTLQRPRQYHVLVIRGDSKSNGNQQSVVGGRTVGFLLGSGGTAGGVQSGQGYALDLPAYENDVLSALARTGGIPGTDAVNEIVIERGGFRGIKEEGVPNLLNGTQGRLIRIPLRLKPGQPFPFQPEDIILETGDIVYIPAREAEVFYTAGQLPAGEYTLPRDSDLDVVQAVIKVGGTFNNGGFSAANVAGTSSSGGIGGPSPSLVTVLRRTPEGGQFAIRVDLNRAMRDPRERLLLKSQDVVMLQERPQEAVTRYVTSIVNVSAFYQLINSSRAQVSASASGP